MTEEHDRQRRDLTFSQREGKAPLPEALEPGKLPRRFRIRVWQVVGEDIESGIIEDSFGDFYWSQNNMTGKFWGNFFLSYQIKLMELAHDDEDIISDGRLCKNFLRKIILEEEYYKVITTIEFMFYCQGMTKTLKDKLKECFEDAPYIVDDLEDPVCIFPVTSKEMKQVVERALANIKESNFAGAKTHLRKSAENINNENSADSIRESIHAVEAVAREIDPQSSKSLGYALNSLEKHGMIKHPDLKEAFKKLYDYTNDEQGIRHPLRDREAADVGRDEAMFMYGACVSFVDYLISKQKQIAQ